MNEDTLFPVAPLPDTPKRVPAERDGVGHGEEPRIPHREIAVPRVALFAVVDHDSDRERGYAGTDGIVEITRGDFKACRLPWPVDVIYVETAPMQPKRFTTGQHFSQGDLDEIAQNFREKGVEIRVMPNRIASRAWKEVEPDPALTISGKLSPAGKIPWDDRDKAQDSRVEYEYLLRHPDERESFKRWPPRRQPSQQVIELRAAIMRDMEDARSLRQDGKHPDTRRLLRKPIGRALTLGTLPYGVRGAFGIHHANATDDEILNVHVVDAYVSACDLETGASREGLSNNLIKRACGFYNNGFGTLARSNAMFHRARKDHVAPLSARTDDAAPRQPRRVNPATEFDKARRELIWLFHRSTRVDP